MGDSGDEGASQPEPEPELVQEADAQPEPAPAPAPGAGSAQADPLARGSAEEKAQLAAAMLLSANDTSADAEAEERQAEPQPTDDPNPVYPASILKNRKNDNPPSCLDNLELEGEAGRKALIVQVQTILRTSPGSDPTPDEILTLREKFVLSQEDLSAVFTYFRELMGTFSASIREHRPEHVRPSSVPSPLWFYVLVQRRLSHQEARSCAPRQRRGATERTLLASLRALAPQRMQVTAQGRRAGMRGTGLTTDRSHMAREPTSGRTVHCSPEHGSTVKRMGLRASRGQTGVGLRASGQMGSRTATARRE
jgi:hypothetical protein